MGAGVLRKQTEYVCVLFGGSLLRNGQERTRVWPEGRAGQGRVGLRAS